MFIKHMIFLQMERDIFFQFPIQYLRVTIFFLFVRDPKENMSDGKKETVSITTFKKWTFADNYRIETEGTKVLSSQLGKLVVKNCENFRHYVDI